MSFVEWLVVAILAAAFVPQIITTLIDVDTSSWNPIGALVWDNLEIFVVVGVLYIFLKKTGILSNRTSRGP